ncbi:hypothetical protein MHYP_G00064860 [Metynnis hypsauchen]
MSFLRRVSGLSLRDRSLVADSEEFTKRSELPDLRCAPPVWSASIKRCRGGRGGLLKYTELDMVQLSKAGMKDTLTLKAGHAPAVKAGGKRVVKKSNEDNGTPEKEGKRPEKPRTLTVSSRMQQIGILMGGPLEKLGHDFPEIPVSVRHSKVRPSVEKPHIQRTFFIQQPRKC